MIVLGVILAIIGAFVSRLLLYIGVALIVLGVILWIAGPRVY